MWTAWMPAVFVRAKACQNYFVWQKLSRMPSKQCSQYSSPCPPTLRRWHRKVRMLMLLHRFRLTINSSNFGLLLRLWHQPFSRHCVLQWSDCEAAGPIWFLELFRVAIGESVVFVWLLLHASDISFSFHTSLWGEGKKCCCALLLPVVPMVWYYCLQCH